MFDNLGKKIMMFAKITCWVGMTASIIGGIILCAVMDYFWYIGLIVMFVAPLIFWACSLTIYGFGEMVDNVNRLKKHFCKKSNTATAQQTTNPKKQKLDALLANGLLSQEEYNKALKG